VKNFLSEKLSGRKIVWSELSPLLENFPGKKLTGEKLSVKNCPVKHCQGKELSGQRIVRAKN
jgi:hypothetical protein